MNRRYYASFDLLRVIMLSILIIGQFGLPISGFGFVQPLFNIVSPVLFTIYGYLVLRDGKDLKKNIKHTIIVFVILFVVYFILAELYMTFVYGSPMAYITKRGIFNFVVLNYWGPDMGDSIWYVQSILYALIICYLFRKLKKFDWVICILLFVFAFFIGEGAALINFNVLKYTYIPGNFLTRTLPYMLLGRILHTHQEKLSAKKDWLWILLIVIGTALCYGELFGLSAIEKFIYMGHLLGFIPMTVGILMLAVRHYKGGVRIAPMTSKMYKAMYFIFDPIGEIILVLFLIKFGENYSTYSSWAGPILLFVSLLIAFGFGWVKNMIDHR